MANMLKIATFLALATTQTTATENEIGNGIENEIIREMPFLTSEKVYSLRPEAESLYSPAHMFKKVNCDAREYACSPQCPTAIWHAKT
eukprot:CAMPEP_0185582996 /NCGR_PEP_ID=MMETSP0434-20130131/21255_1 /TAXON_ID=626734 ORGANISM="Favella taraikaensis, Strain Fe Narragansett Bay" /NCGR_SAMPLE_ID=MMETSP0434 /ASSEMBLY_ACC=CAM_ASM_000379 /LENGTH=87 /DNA_ID=CAMNT_0028201971 /DNA_START=9 /DNA_END=272 /DNA_ORIENTATION=-